MHPHPLALCPLHPENTAAITSASVLKGRWLRGPWLGPQPPLASPGSKLSGSWRPCRLSSRDPKPAEHRDGSFPRRTAKSKWGFCCFPENREQSQVSEPVAQTYSNWESLFKRNPNMTRISIMHPGCLPAVTSLSHPQPKSSGNQEGRTRLTWTPLGDLFPIPAEDGP